MKRRLEPPAPAKFKIGDRVRVKPGISDQDHPDIPLGGWVGTISEVHKRGMYSVRWSKETLASIHPIYKKRCAIDGTVLEEYWLGDDDIEPDPGGPLSIEQPTHITPRPLSAENQGDRVRMPWARWAARIGGGLWSLLVAVAKVQFAQRDMKHIVPRYRKGVGGTVGLVAGALQGAFFGIMAVAFIGAVVGGIVGFLLRQCLGGTNGRFFHVFPGSVLFAAACGVAVQAFYLDRMAAGEGLRLEAEIGLGSALLFCLVAVPFAFLTVRESSQ